MSGDKKRSFVYPRGEVVKQYNGFADAAEEYKKVEWGSAESMRNRFLLAMERLPLSDCGSLLDVGCGTGLFLEMLVESFPHLKLVGVDICDKLVAFAGKRHANSGVTILKQGFLEVQNTFDCISCIGVLQKTDMSLDEFFAHARESVTIGGQLWLDTKHTGWHKFTDGELQPETSYVHFDVAGIRRAAQNHGFVELESFGFLPGANQVTEVEGSHTVIYRCVRTAEKGQADTDSEVGL